MDDTFRVFSNRTFSSKDIEIIKWTRKTYSKLSRSELVGTVCEFLDWNFTSGSPKIDQCKEFLEQLEEEGVIDLPPINTSQQKIGRKVYIPEIEFKTDIVKGNVSEYEPIQLIVVKAGDELKRWRAYVNQFHMLGDKNVFGCRLQYFIKSGETELGCMQFSASSWALEERDKWLGWGLDDRKARLNLIVNNSRFLIFPWVHISNLASKTLSIAVKQIQKDWLREYCYAPVLMETFVDLDCFRGTCYKASNWVCLGKTKGRGRMDRKNERALSQKAIFLYPLQRDFKECLKGEKPYKVVSSDEQF